MPLGFLNRSTSVLQPLLGYGAALFLLMLVWGYQTREEYEEADTVTIIFRCAQVLGNVSNYPDIVVSECQKLRNDK
jgi:hypothetical protein